ncbi:MAG: AsmA family protein [Pseudomonadota bacterium]
MRWVFRLLGLVVLIIIAAIAAIFLLPSDRIAGVVEERFEAATGRALTIDGDVRPSLWPALGVNTGAVSIANADWAGDTPMVAADNLSVSVDIGALIGGEVRINGVTLEAPRIALATDADGRGNWEMTPPAATDTGGTTETSAEPAGGIPAFTLDEAVIADGQVTFQDAAGTQIALSGIDATFTLPDFAGPATLALTASANGAPVSVDASVPAFASFLDSGGAVTLSAGAGDSTVGFDGTAALAPLGVDGSLTADLSDMAGVFAALAMPAPELPEGLGQNTLTVTTALGFDGTTLTLGGTTATLDDNTVTGDIAVALDGPRPRITGTLNAGDFVIAGDEETSEDDVAQAEDTGPEGWSTEPIDVSALGTVDADLTVNATSIRTAQSQIGRTSLDIDIDNARMVIGIRELVAYDGAVDGQIVVNGRSGLSASADLNGSAIAISRLFSELLDYDRLVALGDMEIEVLGSGNSMDALMNSLNGQGSFSFGAGELLGLDLVGMLRNFDSDFVGEASRTIFDSITATFRIVDGVVINDNLTLLAPLLTATGEGNIGLGGQTLNYRLVPKLLGDGQDAISVPLLITGTWSAPKFRLDLESIVQGRIDEEVEALKDEVDDQIRDRVSQELGLTEDQPSAEEAIKDKVEDELKRGLRSLFD